MNRANRLERQLSANDTRKKRLAAFGLPSRDKAIHYAQAATRYRRITFIPFKWNRQ